MVKLPDDFMREWNILNAEIEKQHVVQENCSMFSQRYRDSLDEEIEILESKKSILKRMSDRLKSNS